MIPWLKKMLPGWLRTIIPALWAAGLAWLAARVDLPQVLFDWLGSFGTMVMVPIALALVYPTFRWIESRTWWPDWMTRILMGSAEQPVYDHTLRQGVTRRYRRGAATGAPLDPSDLAA